MRNSSISCSNVIYLDNAATTQCDPRVIEAMTPYWTNIYGNPSSPHVFGQLAHQVIEDCRMEIRSLLRGSGTVLLTAGSTESNNLAVYSMLKHAVERQDRYKILCLSTEHKSIINSITYFGELLGVSIEWIPVQANGLLDLNWFNERMSEEIGGVIVQLANSETGVIQDVKVISEICRNYGAKCFSDITQAIGRIDIDLDDLGVDYASFTAHKFYGPNGVGALYVAPGISVSPIVFGGGQERGARAGTENVPGIVGMTTALRIVLAEYSEIVPNIRQMRDEFWGCLSGLVNIRWNGDTAPRLPSHLNITIHQVNAQDLMLRTRTVAFSAGSACNTGNKLPSPVLLAMGMTKIEAEQTIRLTFGRFNTLAQVRKACEVLVTNIRAIRE